MEDNIFRKEGVSMVKKVSSLGTILMLILILCSCSMEDLPEGELKYSSISPSGTYTVNLYLCDGGSTVDYAVRGEVITNSTNVIRNLYWEYHCEEYDVVWIDDETVIINNKELNVIEDEYDWRDE